MLNSNPRLIYPKTSITSPRSRKIIHTKLPSSSRISLPGYVLVMIYSYPCHVSLSNIWIWKRTLQRSKCPKNIVGLVGATSQRWMCGFSAGVPNFLLLQLISGYVKLINQQDEQRSV
ncbi:hypothetical protein V6N13_088708 [Hibiscus sabdariffa]|uniref:Uncharacterized protein n=1 Tax=Hibiscus sabdariffa TaxID=183260 RepID=A0ABR2G0Z2_9ROSI